MRFACFQLAHFFTSAAGENGSNPYHPDVLSGDLRREMELQWENGIVTIAVIVNEPPSQIHPFSVLMSPWVKK